MNRLVKKVIDGNEIACDTGDDMIEGEVSFETDHAIYTGIIHSKDRAQTFTSLSASLVTVIHQAESNKFAMLSEKHIGVHNEPVR